MFISECFKHKKMTGKFLPRGKEKSDENRHDNKPTIQLISYVEWAFDDFRKLLFTNFNFTNGPQLKSVICSSIYSVKSHKILLLPKIRNCETSKCD